MQTVSRFTLYTLHFALFALLPVVSECNLATELIIVHSSLYLPMVWMCMVYFLSAVFHSIVESVGVSVHSRVDAAFSLSVCD